VFESEARGRRTRAGMFTLEAGEAERIRYEEALLLIAHGKGRLAFSNHSINRGVLSVGLPRFARVRPYRSVLHDHSIAPDSIIDSNLQSNVCCDSSPFSPPPPLGTTRAKFSVVEFFFGFSVFLNNHGYTRL